MFRKGFCILGLILCCIAFFGCSEDDADKMTNLDNPVTVGDTTPGDANLPPAPNFTLLNTELEEVSLTDHRGKVVIVDFWATWCKPCEAEIPLFIELYDQYREQGFEMIGISMDDERLKVIEPFIERLGVNYTILLGEPDLIQSYGVPGLPSAFLIDRDGRIFKAFHGEQGRKEIYESELKKLL